MTDNLESLFPRDLPSLNWQQFKARGFAQPVAGVIYHTDALPCCGVPLGGIDTGCIDLNADGTYGFSSIFNPTAPFPHKEGWRMPRKLPSREPVLGLAVAGKVWVLTTPAVLDGGELEVCTEPYYFANPHGEQVAHDCIHVDAEAGVHAVDEIHYWGHYPVADLEFELDAPVSVGLRAWSPFIPGDAVASNIPAVVFEVHLRNRTGQSQRGTLAFNFPGPDPQEACADTFTREVAPGSMLVRSAGSVEYSLAVLDQGARFGAGLSGNWSQIASGLPQPETPHDAGGSAAVDFELDGWQSTVIRFVLAWYAPVWEGAQNDLAQLDDIIEATYQDRFQVDWLGAGKNNYFTHMYAARYSGALDVLRYAIAEHELLLSRVLAWQAAIYHDESLPLWLRESLVNNLHLIAEDSMWAQANPPLSEWAAPDGIFALNESPRGCPDLACIPCDWYGNFPIVYFFPELARTTLRAFKQYQREDGEIPFWLGKMGDLPDLATPGFHWQVSLNGTCYIDMVYRLWQRTGDATILDEFYESAKHCNTFTMQLRPGEGGVIGMPLEGGMEWFEHGEWIGLCAHLGGLHLAQLRLMEGMADARGDQVYAAQCRAWFEDGVNALEAYLWTGAYYLNFYDPETGRTSDDVMGYQLDGQWVVDFYGLERVFPPERTRQTLATIKRCNVALTPEVGAVNFARPDGAPLPSDSKVAFYGQYAMFPPELLILAMTYIYTSERDFGEDLAQNHWANLVLRQRHPWDLPNIVRGDTGARVFGTDYYQNMMLWNLPAALSGQTFQQFVRPGGLIDRVLEAGKGDSRVIS